MRPKAAPARWPYLEHRTLAEIYSVENDGRTELAKLDQLSRERALNELESRRLEKLVRRWAA